MSEISTEAGRWLLAEYARTPGDPKWFPGMGLESTIVAIEDQASSAASLDVDAYLDSISVMTAEELRRRWPASVARLICEADPAAPLDVERLRRALVEAVLPLEVIAAQDRAQPYAELSRDFIDVINAAIRTVRAALATPAPKEADR